MKSLLVVAFLVILLMLGAGAPGRPSISPIWSFEGLMLLRAISNPPAFIGLP
jgi:hypothetical protein